MSLIGTRMHFKTAERWAIGDKLRETAGLLAYAKVPEVRVWIAEFQLEEPHIKTFSGLPHFVISIHSLNITSEQV
jgi:hypothetical protein